jgi:hypothetical protein
VTTLDSRSDRKGLPTGPNPTWKLSPKAPGVMWSAAVDLAGRLPASVVHPLSHHMQSRNRADVESIQANFQL